MCHNKQNIACENEANLTYSVVRDISGKIMTIKLIILIGYPVNV